MSKQLPFWFILCCISFANLYAQGDSERSRASLAGITSVAVIVSPIDSDIEAKGLTQAGIQTDVELKLRQTGIQVLDKDAWVKNVDTPVVFVQVGFYKIEGTDLYAYSVSVELNQWVKPDRLPSLRVFAPTWSTMSIGTSGSTMLYLLRGVVKNYLDEFLNAYLSVYLKKQ